MMSVREPNFVKDRFLVVMGATLPGVISGLKGVLHRPSTATVYSTIPIEYEPPSPMPFVYPRYGQFRVLSEIAVGTIDEHVVNYHAKLAAAARTMLNPDGGDLRVLSLQSHSRLQDYLKENKLDEYRSNGELMRTLIYDSRDPRLLEHQRVRTEAAPNGKLTDTEHRILHDLVTLGLVCPGGEFSDDTGHVDPRKLGEALLKYADADAGSES